MNPQFGKRTCLRKKTNPLKDCTFILTDGGEFGTLAWEASCSCGGWIASHADAVELAKQWITHSAEVVMQKWLESKSV